ncbi:spore germination protein [Paenibacillus sp. Soil787]|uniref:spore germination protein n=1 Tax=Paenibacillus sp. Soil787 TaxID=1736411 RepID=UPI0009EC8668|nr:spore germination protein [Paenibacillus sp. Soil787]
MKWFRKYMKARQGTRHDIDKGIIKRSIHSVLASNVDEIRSAFTETPDLAIRQLEVKQLKCQAVLVFLEGLVDKNSINNNVIDPLKHKEGSGNTLFDLSVTIGQMKQTNEWREVESAILHGKSVLFVDGSSSALVIDSQGWPQRAIEDPQLETSMRGAHQGLVETGSQSIAMIRRYIPNKELKIRQLMVGSRAECTLSILFLADVAHPELLKELEDRIVKLDIDAIINTGELAELIEDNPYSPFPQFILTERPDAVASQILQGRLAVVVDRSPSVLIAPAGFTSFFQSVDDYSMRWSVASIIRMLRFVGFFMAICLPAGYISLISFNYEMIPLKLLLNIGEYRAQVPFPSILEALLMEIMLEMIREAGIRLPAPVGQSIGVVGAIVVGQAAVQAGIVSNLMIIVVASTAIASFIIPNYDMSAAIRLLRFPMMIITSLFGIVGLVIGLMTLVLHLISLESLGTPYGTPFAPIRLADWKDTFIRMPLWKMDKRPLSTRPVQLQRQGSNRPEGDDT